jgi:hypothetical protein
MPKLELEPRLVSVASDVMEWARRVVGAVNPLVDQMLLKAPLASPALTGSPTAPNNAAGTRGTAIATMQSFADEFANLKTSIGYQKLPSGVIVQWGNSASTGSADTTVTFPVAFPNASASILLTPLTGGATGVYILTIGTYSATGFVFGGYNAAGTRVAVSVFWVAIGF